MNQLPPNPNQQRQQNPNQKPPDPPNPSQLKDFVIFQEAQRVIAQLAVQERVALNLKFQKEVLSKLKASGWESVTEDGNVFIQWPLGFGLPKDTQNKKFLEKRDG